MNSRSRSVLGAALAIFLIPAVFGVLACLPVPIGNPERSEIDPWFSGLWVDHEDGAFSVSNYEPYDKRTWLLTRVIVERTDGCVEDSTDTEPDSSSPLVAMLTNRGSDCYVAEDAQLYKVWLSQFGGYVFMTWEPKGLPPAVAGQEPDLSWWVFRTEKVDSDHLNLWLVELDFEGFEDVDQTRQAFENVLEKHAGNSEMYEDDPLVFRRGEESQQSFLGGFILDIISHD
jgi:hypothetical protein